MEEFTSTEFALARNFGFDITMPDSSMGLAGALHQAYIDRCQRLYREFISNMSTYIKAEKDMKKVLGAIHNEKVNNLRFSLYCSDNTGMDPFSQRLTKEPESPLRGESRGNTPWGLDTIPDVDEETVISRPKTAPNHETRPTSTNTVRPKTAGAKELDIDPDNIEAEPAIQPIIRGVVDPDTERSSSRRITVGHHSFDKLGRSDVQAKLKNKSGRFLMRPMKVNYDLRNVETSTTTAYDPSKRKVSIDPVNEKVALVRKLTSFLTPTISSDLKINNRVPIQKKLKGLDAKRITVSEIFQNARDRQTRHFRIMKITKSERGKESNPKDSFSRQSDTREHGHFRTPSTNAIRRNIVSPAIDEPDFGSSFGSQHHHPKSILHASGVDGETGRGRNCGSRSEIHPDSSFRRSGSRVAFARSDSQLSHSFNHVARETPDPSASFNSQSGSLKKSGNSQYFSGNIAMVENAHAYPKEGVATSPSAVKTNKTSSNIERCDSSLSFGMPTKIESRTDTDIIVKKQREIDEKLNADMTVWRRRMNAKPNTAKSGNRTNQGKGPKLRIK